MFVFFKYLTEENKNIAKKMHNFDDLEIELFVSSDPIKKIKRDAS